MPERPCYIVTGGAGFIGANLCRALDGRARAHGTEAELVVIDDFRSGSFANLVEAFARSEAGDGGGGVFSGEVLAGSVSEVDWDSLLEAREPRAVFHLGAITDTTVANEREMIEVNSETFGPMLEACVRGQVPLVYASSAATYGTPAQAASREAFPLEAAGRPNNVYGFSKWLMEVEHRRALAEASRAGREMPHVVGLRYFNVFGPGEGRKGKMASMVHQLAVQLLEGESPRLFEHGEQARDQVPVEDVVSCTIAAAGRAAWHEFDVEPGVYNLGSGRATTFNELVEAVRSALEFDAGERPTEYFEMPPSVRAFYQEYTCADMRETERGLGWKPSVDPVRAMGDTARHIEHSRRGSGGAS
ncbi:MAG: NAD-dependent epimerase/dehydratase family protein [Phycisphaerales bacterium]|nr:MAG: NAD-dependent epimerase/dehydratase family protein [Phycisphaerales bacterium]